MLSLQTEKKEKSGKAAGRTTIVEQQWQGGAPVEERVLAVREDVDDDELELELSGSGEMRRRIGCICESFTAWGSGLCSQARPSSKRYFLL